MARSWSNIPDDITSLFINRLSYVDQIRFQVVCKNWREAAKTHIVEYADKLPWIMAHNSGSCFLYDPYHKRQYNVFSNDTSREETFAHTRALDTKYGWVLLSRYPGSTIFFYNPFIDKILQLPKLPLLKSVPVGTFTQTPVSSDCLIFVVTAHDIFSPSRAHVRISMCKPGDTEWSELQFQSPYNGDAMDVEYVGGVLYCTFTGVGIGVFNLALKDWKIHPYPYLIDELVEVVRRDCFTECDGELLLSQYLDDEPGFAPTFDRSEMNWRILKLDRSQMRWLPVESLDNCSLFLSDACISIPVEKGSELANTLHYYYRTAPGPRSHPLCPQISEIYAWNIEGLVRKLWIQPPDPKFSLRDSHRGT